MFLTQMEYIISVFCFKKWIRVVHKFKEVFFYLKDLYYSLYYLKKKGLEELELKKTTFTIQIFIFIILAKKWMKKLCFCGRFLFSETLLAGG